tara:strand:+ start:216 stop:2591 length:2376 start_codon:yes stop_codon:yes gene_type:complete
MKKLQTTIATLCAAGALTLPVTPAQAAEKTSFDAVTAKLDPNGHLYAYMNTAKVMKQLDQMVESLIAMTEEGGDDSIFNNPLFGPMIGNLVGAIKPAYDESGLSRIDGVGMSSFAVREDLWRSKMYVHRSSPEDEGLIWKILGSEPHELSVLDLAPENTAVLAHSDLDINALLGWIDRISAKMNDGQTLTAEMPGEAKDVLNSYGGEVGFLMTLDPEKQITLPGFMFQMEEDIEMDSFAFALMLRAKDDTLLTMLNDAMSGGLAPPQKTKVGLVTLHSVPMPMPIPIPGLDITPCYFQVDDYMVFTSSTALGKAIIEAKNGKGKLTENDEFKSITKGIDLKGNGISYASTASIEWGGKINELTMGQMPDELKKTFQIYLDYTKTMKGMVSLIKSDKDGVLIETHSNVNLYGEYMVHTFASIGIMVANSMQELNNSGMFEDLNDFGGFDEGPGAFNEPEPEFEPSPAGKLAIAHWVKGEEVDLSEGVNVVEFWATWCPPCLTSIPHLTTMQKRYKEHGVNIIGISDEPLKTVEPFVKKMGDKMEYIVAIDDNDITSREYMGRYGIGGIPHAFVVKDGTVVWHGHPMSGLDKAIEEALGGVAAKSDADHFGEFYAENTIGEEYQLTTAQLAEIIKREEDRSAVPELYKRIGLDKYTKGTVTLNYFSPNGAPQPGPPPFGIKLKFVSGGYSVEEADFPTPTGGTDKVHHVVAVIEERRAFVNHVFKEGDLIGVGIREMINDTDSKLTGIGINPDGSTYNFTSKDNLSNGLVKGETTYTVDGVVVSKSKSTIQFE